MSSKICMSAVSTYAHMDLTPKLSSANGVTLIFLGIVVHRVAFVGYTFILEGHLMLFGGR